MPTTSDNKSVGDSIQLIAKRNDGSVRQVLVQDSFGNVLARGYFPAGTFMEESGWLSKRSFHWIDSWSDEELLNPENNLDFTKEKIYKLREESVLANLNKEFVTDNLENHKRK